MKFLESPAAFVASVMLGILAFGIGLTSPIWFLLDGKNPVEAMRAGTPIVGLAIVGLVVMVVLGIVVQRLRKPPPPDEPAVYVDAAADSRKHRIVHVVTVLMFVVPFATVVLGYLLKGVIDAE